MKKIGTILISLGLIYGLFGVSTPVEAYYPCEFRNSSETGNCEGCGQLPSLECQANCTPTWSGYSCNEYLSRKNTPARTTCQEQTVYSYPTMYSVGNTPCYCPNGTYVAFGGITTTPRCNSFSPSPNPTPTPACMEPIPGYVSTAQNIPCRCPDGTTRSSNGGYARCQNYVPPVTCWNGSTAPTANACPGYKYCPNDSVKHALSYTCPPQTQTCWNGTVISIYQTCPSRQPTCNYSQYWNGYQCITDAWEGHAWDYHPEYQMGYETYQPHNVTSYLPTLQQNYNNNTYYWDQNYYSNYNTTPYNNSWDNTYSNSWNPNYNQYPDYRYNQGYNQFDWSTSDIYYMY